MNEKEIIEILEELKDKYISSGIAQFSILELDEDEKQAIEGLSNLYNKEKEKNNSISIQYEKVVDKLEDLEQIEKEHKEENGRLREENINLKEKIIRQQEQLNIANKKILAQKGQLKVVNNSYIPKSKVKEKMELLREDIQYSANPLSIDNSKYAIEVLQELLEESEK